MEDLTGHLRQILTPEVCLATYRLKFPYDKGQMSSGAVTGQIQFSPTYMQELYDLIYHEVLIPLSQLPLDSLLAVDLTHLLPHLDAPDYPEQCLGLVTILDQQRILTAGYSKRYTHAFFDPVCEKLSRQLVALPEDARPDGKRAWLSRGYSFEDWLARALWLWTPLVHSDDFMVKDRSRLKQWLHSMRAETEGNYGHPDPFATLEQQDDVNIRAFQTIEAEGPPLRSYFNPDIEATMQDYAFWWIRILNSHFAITDMCGHYPYWIRWKGHEWTDADKKFMIETNYYRHDEKDEIVLDQIRQDFLDGVWRPLMPNPGYEKER